MTNTAAATTRAASAAATPRPAVARRKIPFSPPDIGQAEIDEVVDTLKSGWITTGPKTKAFERELTSFTGAAGTACFSSATTALESSLRALGIGPGDEVVTSAYTYTASASPIVHVGATPVLVDVDPASYVPSAEAFAAAVTPRTRAVVPVDIAGAMVDYAALADALDAKRAIWQPTSERQSAIGRVAIVADGAHSLGAERDGLRSGQAADITTFSFHAVKNLTTAEGGAAVWRDGLGFDGEELYRDFMLLSLHGQTKDALSKAKAGAWEYDIAFPGYKCNMTDIQASLGLAQLRRYDAILARRHEIASRYERALKAIGLEPIEHDGSNFRSSAHLMLVQLPGRTRAQRDKLIELLSADGIATNVHYKPLPMLTAYRDLGFRIEDYPNALAMFEREISLPLHTLLTDDDVDYVCDALARRLAEIDAQGAA